MKTYVCLFLTICMISGYACNRRVNKKPRIEGEMKKWHTLTFSFEGPETSENDDINPFLDYRLNVNFSINGHDLDIPGYYAADGNAGQTGASSGNIWKVHFCPDREGTWEYTVSFKKGRDIAVSDDPEAGEPVYFDGAEGSFDVGPAEKKGKDFRAKGRLQYTGSRYLQFAETGEYFLKGGADSPENFLAYRGFDGTRYGGSEDKRRGEALPNKDLHAYAEHVSDWNEGDPVWKGDQGKGVIGALNYLSSKGMNSVYFLTMNIMADGRDVWPWTRMNERYRFDCSKLDQWEIVFSHAERKGIMLHFVTQETENELLLDIGFTREQRKLYYRELIARFSHHLAITWNLGEENGRTDWSAFGQNDEQRKEMAGYFEDHDPYGNFVVIHTHSYDRHRDEIIMPLLGFRDLDGLSLQAGNVDQVHEQILKWLTLSGDSGKQWVVCLDEIGPASTGVKPDTSAGDNHLKVRHKALWSSLMAGSGGVEWYFGYCYPHNDLNCEDWRSRDKMWDQTRFAIDFFQNYLPFTEMESMDERLINRDGYCFGKKDQIYVLYLPEGGTGMIDLGDGSGSYSVRWYDPRNGGDLKTGDIDRVQSGKTAWIGHAPEKAGIDWVVLLTKEV